MVSITILVPRDIKIKLEELGCWEFLWQCTQILKLKNHV